MQMTELTDDKDDEEIRRRAYMIWLDEGQPDGLAEDHWHQAAAEIREEAERRERPGSPIEQMGDKTATRSEVESHSDTLSYNR
jgi:Protein of unknown function (DUF2934)